MKNQVIIFDFDGTLADVIPVFREIYDELTPKYGLRPISDQDYIELRKKSIWGVMFWVRLAPWRLKGLLKDGRRLFAGQKNRVDLFPGIPELLKKLHKDGHKLYILSSNRERSIRAILERYDLNYEMIVMKRPKFFGKAGSISKLVAQHSYDRKNTWMIGDETRDVNAGNGARVNTIAVTWGLQAGEILKTKKPDHIANSVKDIAKIFSN